MTATDPRPCCAVATQPQPPEVAAPATTECPDWCTVPHEEFRQAGASFAEVHSAKPFDLDEDLEDECPQTSDGEPLFVAVEQDPGVGTAPRAVLAVDIDADTQHEIKLDRENLDLLIYQLVAIRSEVAS